MKQLLSIPAYIWAIICMLLIPATFIGNTQFAKQLARLPFMKVNPIYSGGDIDRSYQQDSITVTINKPVFAALIGTSSKGFVQVTFSGKLPETINSAIDYNSDNQPDFNVTINTATNSTKFEALSENVTGLNVSSRVKDCWIVRANILNPDKK
ncbi:hypothetical protein CYCD_21610 [Tenuifilaceae bacterium CYCD]|nr:hypothetical protein CYCD_21610 [Tenuifilaceae bacterium CYCD]